MSLIASILQRGSFHCGVLWGLNALRLCQMIADRGRNTFSRPAYGIRLITQRATRTNRVVLDIKELFLKLIFLVFTTWI